MQRFVLRENIERFEKYLGAAPTGPSHLEIRRMLASARQELAIIEATADGVRPGPNLSWVTAQSRPRFRNLIEGSGHPCLIIDPRPGLHIVDANAAYYEVSMTAPETICGLALFDAFPDNPDNPEADGVANLFASLRLVANTGRHHVMDVQRHDAREPSGHFSERHWFVVNTPILDADGKLIYLLHKVEDVTGRVTAGITTGAGFGAPHSGFNTPATATL